MGNGVNLPAVISGDLLGVMIMAELYFGKSWKAQRENKESKLLLYAMIVVVLSCICDTLCVASDGRAGTIFRIFNYVCNYELFIGTLVICPLWVLLLSRHIDGEVSKVNAFITKALCIFGLVVLAINIFTPVIFEISTENVYSRSSLYWIFGVIEVFFILDGLYIYLRGKLRGGALKFFPVIQFVIPVAIGFIVQSAYYGVSLIWPSISVAMCGLITGIQSEHVFTDRLTGIYNRFYLDELKRDIGKKKSGALTAMMLDMNDFKSINDNFGHSEGDVALITVADILKKTVGALGNVIRYAGDEFVVLLNTEDQLAAADVVSNIKNNIEDYNAISGKKYRLSLSIGYCAFDFKEQTVDDLLEEVDRRMYEDKKKFYAEHAEVDRRKR